VDPLDMPADTSKFICSKWRNADLTVRQLMDSRSQPY
jgi:hypothetical protein